MSLRRSINLLILRRRINRWVPPMRDELAHRWEPVKFHECETCGYHLGFRCLRCGIAVDQEQAYDLYILISKYLEAEAGDKP